MSNVVTIGSRASKLARTQVTEWLTPLVLLAQGAAGILARIRNP
ncbi:MULTISPECIES: hypothetical protein [unclassified Streptomyces]|uniref:Uncharacterized protein n=1 Tax=Streptomyces sp. R33 TaxID=3238629 RepID=A0AB39YDC5_9ACTN|nr:hypothetical protein [Streptomyces sp. XY332]